VSEKSIVLSWAHEYLYPYGENDQQGQAFLSTSESFNPPHCRGILCDESLN
jgi:hypothetical protein